MSFARQVKNEILVKPIDGECCKLAFLSAVIHSSGELLEGNSSQQLQLRTDIENLYHRINECLKTLYGEYAEISIDTDSNVNKTVRYVITFPQNLISRILFDCGISKYNNDSSSSLSAGLDEHIVENECCARTYIKGVLVTSSTSSIILDEGSKKKPRSFGGYHWEFIFSNQTLASDFSTLLFSLGLTNNKSKRKKLFIIYIKEAEKVSDLLAMVGAVGSLLKLQNEMTVRQVRNNINRQNNCFNANITKTVQAGLRQVVAIKKIKRTIGLDALPENLRELSLLRLSHPDESLENLTKMLTNPITKSGVNHQLNKLMKIAEKPEKIRKKLNFNKETENK